MKTINEEWLGTLGQIITHGEDVGPRGKPTLEILQHTVRVDMRYPILTIGSRQLSYRFMAAEAFWILSGSDTVAEIAPWNPRIAEFSDDGKTFFGAYGPKISAQLDYVVAKLKEDRSSRQAGLTIWRERPPKTKDVPCTIAAFANIRGNKLNVHVFMRSSDAWLGLPYDVFNFSMLGHLICAKLNAAGMNLVPGTLHLTAASSHLYEHNWVDAKKCLYDTWSSPITPTPATMYLDEVHLMQTLGMLRDSSRGDAIRFWES